MTEKIFVWVTTRFAAFHKWDEAPDKVAFLRDYHRHEFHVRLTVQVTEADREVEFLQLKDELEGFLNLHLKGKRFEYSCETIARLILDRFPNGYICEVSEDGENGATVIRDRTLPPIAQKEEEEIVVQGQKKCFIGIEAEGPLCQTPTLFIPGKTESHVAHALIVRYVRDEGRAVYYGAADDLDLNLDTFRIVISDTRMFGVPLTIECRSHEEYKKLWAEVRRPYEPSGRAIYLVTHDPADLLSQDTYLYLKIFIGDWIIWMNSANGTYYRTRKDDPLFSQDKEVDL